MPTYATSRPPTAGPTSTPICMPRLVSALAAMIWSCRTVRGISASRDGRCMRRRRRPAAPATTKISGTLGSSRNALTASTAVNDRLRDAGADQQLAPVDVVGQRAAVQAEDDQRHQLDQADRADREVGAGQRVDLERDGDVGDHRAEVEDRAGDEQQPEVARLAQRRDVHPQRAQPVTPASRTRAPRGTRRAGPHAGCRTRGSSARQRR